MMNQVSSLVIIHDKKASPSFSLHWRSSAQMFFGLFCVWCSAFSAATLCKLSCSEIAKFSDNGHSCWFPSPPPPRGGKCFTCHDALRILNYHIDLVFGVLCLCLGWSTAVGPVTCALFIAFKMTNPVSDWANVCGVLTVMRFVGMWEAYMYTSQTSVNLSEWSLPQKEIQSPLSA
jgi:hypothetical protein